MKKLARPRPILTAQEAISLKLTHRFYVWWIYNHAWSQNITQGRLELMEITLLHSGCRDFPLLGFMVGNSTATVCLHRGEDYLLSKLYTNFQKKTLLQHGHHQICNKLKKVMWLNKWKLLQKPHKKTSLPGKHCFENFSTFLARTTLLKNSLRSIFKPTDTLYKNQSIRFRRILLQTLWHANFIY